jgi:hypothetical protein
MKHSKLANAHQPGAWIDQLPFASQFRRSRAAVLLLRTLCALHVSQSWLEAYAARS